MNYSNGGKIRRRINTLPLLRRLSVSPSLRLSAKRYGETEKRGNGEGTFAFARRVLAIIKKIPKGKVLAYGQVATIAGVPRAARIVGGILFQQGPMSRVPWQRVINSKGGISTYRVGFGEKQKALLEREGIIFNADGHLDLKKHQWWPSKKFLNALEVDAELAASVSKKFGF